MPCRTSPLYALALCAPLWSLAQTASAPVAPACAGPRAAALDFWVGRWRVLDARGGEEGVDVVEKSLKGCVLIERWRGAGGDEGMSLFHFDATHGLWHQRWVEDDTRAVGGIKDKLLVSAPGAPTLRFQGTLIAPGDLVLLDRTTLAPLADGRVHQLIEVSRDGGANWRTSFDGWYVRMP